MGTDTDTTSPLLVIHRTSGGQATVAQTAPCVGRPERTSWSTDAEAPEFAADRIPGGQALPDGRTSGIVVPVHVDEQYIDEDGMSFGLGADEGYVWTARVRPAAAAEAAPILEREHQEELERGLRRRIRSLLSWRGADPERGALYPHPLVEGEPTPASAHRVPCPPSGYDGEPASEVLVDRAAGLVWTLAYNGAGGDDHARSNWGSWIAIRHPLTPERDQLIADLTRVYATDDQWRALGVEPQAQAELLAAGWTLSSVQQVRVVRVVDVADARALIDHPGSWWHERGWTWDDRHPPVSDRWRAGEALELIAHGITARAAYDRRRNGHTTVAAALAAAPPPVPEAATRIQLVPPPQQSRLGPVWADSAEHMRAHLAPRGDRWGWRVQAETGPQIVHVAPTGVPNRDWMLWDDDRVTTGWWHDSSDRPAHLTAPAAQAVTLAARAGRETQTELWRPLLAATAHTRIRHPETETPADYGIGVFSRTEEHRFSLPTGEAVWFLVSTEAIDPEGEPAGEETGLYTDAAAAERAARDQVAALCTLFSR